MTPRVATFDHRQEAQRKAVGLPAPAGMLAVCMLARSLLFGREPWGAAMSGLEREGVSPRHLGRTCSPAGTAAGSPPLAGARAVPGQLLLRGWMVRAVSSQIEGCRVLSWRR